MTGPGRHRLHDLPLPRRRRRRAPADAVPRRLRHARRRPCSTTPTTCTPSPTGIPQFVLTDVRVPAAAILGGVGRADELTNEWFVEERIHIGARCSGRDGAAADAGGRVGDRAGPVRRADLRLPGRVSFPLADSAADASAARLLTRECAWLADAGADPKVVHAKASLAKLFASEAAFRCADRVVQVFGGRGYMREYAGRAVLPRAARRPDLGGHLGDPAADHRPGAREARRRPGRRMTATAAARRRRHRPAAAVRAAVASPSSAPRRGRWIAETVRDNLRVMGSATRCHFVNPKYDELHGQPCYPSPRRAARAARHRGRRAQPAACRVGHRGGGRGRRARPSSSRAAASSRAARPPPRCRREVARIAREHGLALVGPNCMGVIDLDRQQPRPTSATSRRTCPAAAWPGSPSRARSPTRSSTPGSRVGFSRIISCGSEVVLDVCDYLAYCLDDPETTLGHPVRRGLQAAGAVPRPGRPGARAGQADHGRQGRVGATRRRPPRSPTPGSLAGEARVTDAALDAAGVIRCARPRRAARDGRARRGRPADRAARSAAAGPAS